MKAIKTFSALLLVFIAVPCIAMALEWHIETVDSEIGQYTSISLDSSDHPHISYFGGCNLKYAYFDGSSWHIETVDSGGCVGKYTSISLDSGGYPHISYVDDTNDDLKYAYFDGSSWHIETVDSGGNVGLYNSLCLDSSDYPHISYFDWNNYHLKYAYFDGSAWQIETVDSVLAVGEFTSLSLDSSDHPHISYRDSTYKHLKYAYFDGSNWHIETVDNEFGTGTYTSLSLDSGDYPHISYLDEMNADLKYAYFDGSAWHIETVDSGNVGGRDTSISLDSGDYPHISYCDTGEVDLKYAYFDGSAWHIETVDSNGWVGEFTSVSLDSSDYPHISYFDNTNDDLKYAYAYSPVEPPTVTGVTPQSRGQGAEGQDIVVTGANFMDGAAVSFSGDGITVNSTTFVSSTELTANIDIADDATVSVRDVIVTNPDEQTGTGEDMFSVNAAPTVSGTEPSSLPQGATEDVTISGSGFVANLPGDANGPQLSADFSDGITVNSVTFVSGTELSANISIADDAAVGDRDVTVVNGDAGVGIGVGIFTVIEPLPLIERISPEIGQISGGDEVTITGNYFQDGATVTIGGNPATEVTVDSETQITAQIPPGELGITDVVVTNPDEQSSTLVRGFAYIPVYGDVSGNETVSAYDAALILRFVVGLMSEFPVQQLLSPNQNITPRNYTLSIPKQSAKAGSKIQIPIVIDDATGLNAGGISISYDASVLKAVKALPTEMLNGSYWKTNVSLPSEVRFAFATTELMQGSGSLLTIEFQVLPGAEGKSSPLSFESINLSNSLSIGKIDGLITVLPAKTALFSNYPNPFNPETWIPYQLSQDAPVAIYIYSSNGQLVRRLSLGHQSAGVYVSRSQPARWDGKDSFGEKVASGVYFYTLQAGKFTATRRMLMVK